MLGIFFWFMQQMAGLVTDYMEAYGTKFAWKCVPKRVDKLSSGAFQVTWTDTQTGNEHNDTYDSVLWAVGESVCVCVCVCLRSGLVHVNLKQICINSTLMSNVIFSQHNQFFSLTRSTTASLHRR